MSSECKLPSKAEIGEKLAVLPHLDDEIEYVHGLLCALMLAQESRHELEMSASLSELLAGANARLADLEAELANERQQLVDCLSDNIAHEEDLANARERIAELERERPGLLVDALKTTQAELEASRADCDDLRGLLLRGVEFVEESGELSKRAEAAEARVAWLELDRIELGHEGVIKFRAELLRLADAATLPKHLKRALEHMNENGFDYVVQWINNVQEAVEAHKQSQQGK
jgi:hypothetical protein